LFHLISKTMDVFFLFRLFYLFLPFLCLIFNLSDSFIHKLRIIGTNRLGFIIDNIYHNFKIIIYVLNTPQ